MTYRTYSEYLKTPQFLAVRRHVMERAAGICEHENEHLERCKNIATEVHHLKYPPWGTFDVPQNLIAICHECHCDLHRCAGGCGGYIGADAIKAGRDVCFSCYKG